jgi:hypothetical protein
MPGIVNTTASTLPLHLRGFKEAIDAISTETPDFCAKLFRKMSTDQLGEELLWFSGLPRAVRHIEGGPVPMFQLSVPKRKTFYRNLWAVACEISGRALDTDQTDRMRNIGKYMGISHYNARQRQLHSVIDNATSASFTGIDGVALASISHITKSTTFSNISTAETFSPSALKQLVTDVSLHQTWQDEPWVSTYGWTLFCHTNLKLEAQEVLRSELIAQEMSNTKNVFADGSAGITGFVASPFFVDTNFFCIVPNGEKNPLFELKGSEIKPVHMPTINHTEQYSSIADYTTGWTGPWGFQYNAGA